MEMIKCHVFLEYLTDENDFDKDCTDLKKALLKKVGLCFSCALLRLFLFNQL